MANVTCVFTFVCVSVAEYNQLWAKVIASIAAGRDADGNRLFNAIRIGAVEDNTFSVQYDHLTFA